MNVKIHNHDQREAAMKRTEENRQAALRQGHNNYTTETPAVVVDNPCSADCCSSSGKGAAWTLIKGTANNFVQGFGLKKYENGKRYFVIPAYLTAMMSAALMITSACSVPWHGEGEAHEEQNRETSRAILIGGVALFSLGTAAANKIAKSYIITKSSDAEEQQPKSKSCCCVIECCSGSKPPHTLAAV